MIESQTYEQILEQMEQASQAYLQGSFDQASDFYIKLKVLAAQVYSLQKRTEWVFRQSFPHTAAGEYLDLHAGVRNLVRIPAQKAAGTIVFSLEKAFETERVFIAAGEICIEPNTGLRYRILEDAVIPPKELAVEVPAQAEEAGWAYNAAAGTPLELKDSFPGISAVSSIFWGGAEAESDERLRKRVQESYAVIPNGANKAFYIAEAMQVDSVTSASVVSTEAPFHLELYIAEAYGPASASLIQAVQERMDAIKPYGVMVTVKSGIPKQLELHAIVSVKRGFDPQQVKMACEEKLYELLSVLGVGQSVCRRDLYRVVEQIEGIAQIEFGPMLEDVLNNGTELFQIPSLEITAIR